MEASLTTSLDQDTSALVAKDDDCMQMVSMGRVLPLIFRGWKQLWLYYENEWKVCLKSCIRKWRRSLTIMICVPISSPHRPSSFTLSGLVLIFFRSCFTDWVCCSPLTLMCMVRSWNISKKTLSESLKNLLSPSFTQMHSGKDQMAHTAQVTLWNGRIHLKQRH